MLRSLVRYEFTVLANFLKLLTLRTSLLKFLLVLEGTEALRVTLTISSIIKLLAEEIINLIDHDVYHLFRSAIVSFEAKQYYPAGVATGKIVGIILNVN